MAGVAAAAGVVATMTGAAGALATAAARATRMRLSPAAYSISLSPVCSSRAASPRTRSASADRSCFAAMPGSLGILFSACLDDRGDGVEREQIGLRAEAADHAARDGADMRMAAIALAREDVAQMHLDHR